MVPGTGYPDDIQASLIPGRTNIFLLIAPLNDIQTLLLNCIDFPKQKNISFFSNKDPETRK
jgi:hypothetical protein